MLAQHVQHYHVLGLKAARQADRGTGSLLHNLLDKLFGRQDLRNL